MGIKGSSTASPGGELTEISILFSISWEIYKRRIGVLVSLYLFSFFVCIATIALFAGAGFLLSIVLGDAKEAVVAAGVITGILAGMIVICWGLAAGVFAVTDADMGIKDALARGWQRIGAFIWFFSIAGFIITGGFLLLIVPGVIFLVWFAFGQFILADNDERGMNALLKSKELVRGHWPDVFLRLFLVWIASGVVGIVPLIGPLLTIAFMPFMTIFIYLIYKDLKEIKGDISYSPSSGEKIRWIGIGTLGYIVLPVIILVVLGVSIALPLLLIKAMLGSAAR